MLLFKKKIKIFKISLIENKKSKVGKCSLIIVKLKKS